MKGRAPTLPQGSAIIDDELREAMSRAQKIAGLKTSTESAAPPAEPARPSEKPPANDPGATSGEAAPAQMSEEPQASVAPAQEPTASAAAPIPERAVAAPSATQRGSVSTRMRRERRRDQQDDGVIESIIGRPVDLTVDETMPWLQLSDLERERKRDLLIEVSEELKLKLKWIARHAPGNMNPTKFSRAAIEKCADLAIEELRNRHKPGS